MITAATAYASRDIDTREKSPGLLPIATLVLWLLPLAIGIVGLRLPYPSLEISTAPASTVQTQIIKVDLRETPPPAPRPPAHLAPNSSQLSIPTEIPTAPALPALPEAPPIAVAQPSPAIAFALPVEGYTRIVDAGAAAHIRPSTSGRGNANAGYPTGPRAPAEPVTPPAPATPAVTHLTFGEGAGNQPAPEYPHDAVAAHQEGTVTLRFSVDETGTVTKVDIITPSKWRLLNKAAEKTVKDSWHFPPGNPRIYEVPIQFQLTQ